MDRKPPVAPVLVWCCDSSPMIRGAAVLSEEEKHDNMTKWVQEKEKGWSQRIGLRNWMLWGSKGPNAALMAALVASDAGAGWSPLNRSAVLAIRQRRQFDTSANTTKQLPQKTSLRPTPSLR